MYTNNIKFIKYSILKRCKLKMLISLRIMKNSNNNKIKKRINTKKYYKRYVSRSIFAKQNKFRNKHITFTLNSSIIYLFWDWTRPECDCSL